MREYLSKAFVDDIKSKYPPGSEIVLDHMNDGIHPIPDGTKGTVRLVDDIGTIHVEFDNGRYLGVIPGEDSFHRVNIRSFEEQTEDRTGMTIRPMKPEERKYTYTQSDQIMKQTGNICHLRGEVGTLNSQFRTTFYDHVSELKTSEFNTELQKVIETLRNDDGFGGVLRNKETLRSYCYRYPAAEYGDSGNFGFRVDTEKYTYLLRLNTIPGEYNMYCYCYDKALLEKHMEAASKGIRFIDSSYNSKFIIPDGGKVKISYPDGKSTEKTCRYVDDYHLEFGYGFYNMFHICELAEMFELQEAKVEPVEPMLAKNKGRGAR